MPFTNKFLYTPDLFYTGDPVTETFQIIISATRRRTTSLAIGSMIRTHGPARELGPSAQPDDLTVTIPIAVHRPHARRW